VLPDPEDFDYELDSILASVVGIRSIIPNDASTAETLGTERSGNGALIRGDGVVLTIGYLITEAQTVWISLNDGRALPGHVLAYDQETGFGLVQVLAHLKVPFLPLGESSKVEIGERVLVGGAGGRQQSITARVVAKQEFAGYWEYLLDEAILTAPAHPKWGGTALIAASGELVGIGSLQLQQTSPSRATRDLNLFVPIDLLKPILDDLLTLGRANRPARPWLGLFATQIGKSVIVAGLARQGPAERSGLRIGDILLCVGEKEIGSLADFFRRVWSLGQAGIEVPLIIGRDGQTLETRVRSADRSQFLKKPVTH
jgi:S1-C subfamily serine protease